MTDRGATCDTPWRRSLQFDQLFSSEYDEAKETADERLTTSMTN
jgi:hypothetical protein